MPSGSKSLGDVELSSQLHLHPQILPMACNSGAFTAAQHARYQSLVAALHTRVEGVEELPEGYAFRFPS